ncbi:MAG: ABC transporter ATP-binding protein [Oscillospiraceae bacterium]|jgi:iron complex transport system ATP-binding protein
MRLKIKNMHFSYGEERAIDDISLEVERGEFVGLIGPNGSGKSTLLKALYRAIQPDGGAATLDGQDLLSMSSKKVARHVSVLGQENCIPFGFTVEEIVAMGRTPYKKLFEGDSPDDRWMVNNALEHLGMEKMAGRNFLHLSGGEKQRVLLARVIAQDTDFIILDEPTNHLDVGYQIQIFDLVKRLDATVLAAMHDLNMAASYCDRIYAIKDGKIYASGTPEEVLTPENIFELYGVHAVVTRQEFTGLLNVSFLPERFLQRGNLYETPRKNTSFSRTVPSINVPAVAAAGL